MAYTYTNSRGVLYYLNEKEVTLRGGKKQMIRFFTKEPRDTTIDELPEGFEVNENDRNGFCTLKRKK